MTQDPDIPPVTPPPGGAAAVRVLAVDDQPVFRAVVRALIEASPGFEFVGEAASGPEAIAAAGALRPDLVLMDVRMPGMDGIEAARRLGDCEPGAVVVLVSLEDPPNMGSVIASGALYVRKQDLSPRRLAELWRSASAGAGRGASAQHQRDAP